MAQLDTVASGLSQVQSGLVTLNNHISIAYSGVAMGMAMNAAPLSLNQGEQGLSGGVATFGGRTAFGFHYQGQPTAKVSVGVAIGVSDSGTVGASAGVGVKF
jgi:hypothetical protein